MKLKEYAAAFGMSVEDLCVLTGYSRQGLNEIIHGRSTKESDQRRAARRKLNTYTIDQCTRQIWEAQETRDQRIKLAELI